MKTIVIILLLIFVSVGVIAVYFPDIINNTTPSILQPDTQQTTTKPPSKCVTGFFAVVDMYPPTVEALEKAQWQKGKPVNDINECKNDCDKYAGCKSYVYHSNDKLCWLGSDSTFKTVASYNTSYTSCLK